MIRKFSILDIDRIMQLWLDANLDVHYFINKSYWLNHYEMVKQMILDADIYVYEINYKVLGFIGIVDNYIAGIFADKAYRCQNVGHQLINYIKKDHKYLILSVYQKNQKAVNFYIKEKFKIIKEQIDLDTNEVELVMEYNHKRIESK